MKKVLIIGSSTVDESPYIQAYLDVFKRHAVPFDFIFWNKHLDKDTVPVNYIPYNCYYDNRYPFWRKFLNIFKYSLFIKHKLREKEYAFVITFTIAQSMFIYPFLKEKYKGKYIFDIRDYSPMCRIAFFQKILIKLIDNSYFTAISSEGFMSWLPNVRINKYKITHNIPAFFYNDNKSAIITKPKDKIKILTIGQIAYCRAQQDFIDKISECNIIDLHFVGYGFSVPILKKYVEDNHITNVFFHGKYKKKDEDAIVCAYDMINIYFNHGINEDTLLTNRFYLSVRLRKPMIVLQNTYQAALVEKYELGLIVSEKDDLVSKINFYWTNFDSYKFEKGCTDFLKTVKEDMLNFQEGIMELYNLTK